jgi:peptide/nickel transport system permease protein
VSDEHALPATPGAAPDKAQKRRLGWFFWVCVGWIGLVVFGAVFASVLPLQDPTLQPTNPLINAGPSMAHWFGTDTLGRTIFSRVVYGARVSLIVGFGAIAIGLVLGGIPGMIAGYARGLTDAITNAVFYVLLAVPPLVAVIAIVTFWKPALFKITLVLGVAASPLIFRLVRASTLSYASRDFVTAARSLGATNLRILFKEILPNIVPAVVSFSLIGVATVVVLEGTLAFLGLSVPNTTPSWGNMLNESLAGLNDTPGLSNPWLVIFPAAAMFLFLLALNLVGDRLRQYFDVAEIKL